MTIVHPFMLMRVHYAMIHCQQAFGLRTWMHKQPVKQPISRLVVTGGCLVLRDSSRKIWHENATDTTRLQDSMAFASKRCGLIAIKMLKSM